MGRLIQIIKRRRAARSFGISYARGASFDVPDSICVGERTVRLNIPLELGQKTAFVELLLDDCYELEAISRARDIRTVLDVGANVGLFSIGARKVFPKAMIHAYEPNPDLAPMLNQHACQAGFQVFLEAVGRDNGTVDLVIDSTQSVLTKTRPAAEGEITQRAFKDVLARLGGYVDLVKLDCEGAEWELFEDRESWARVNWLTMEYHLMPNQTHSDIVKTLSSIGFLIVKHAPATNFGLIQAVRSEGRQAAA